MICQVNGLWFLSGFGSYTKPGLNPQRFYSSIKSVIRWIQQEVGEGVLSRNLNRLVLSDIDDKYLKKIEENRKNL